MSCASEEHSFCARCSLKYNLAFKLDIWKHAFSTLHIFTLSAVEGPGEKAGEKHWRNSCLTPLSMWAAGLYLFPGFPSSCLSLKLCCMFESHCQCLRSIWAVYPNTSGCCWTPTMHHLHWIKSVCVGSWRDVLNSEIALFLGKLKVWITLCWLSF